MTPCPQPGDRTQGRRCLSQSPPPPNCFPRCCAATPQPCAVVPSPCSPARWRCICARAPAHGLPCCRAGVSPVQPSSPGPKPTPRANAVAQARCTPSHAQLLPQEQPHGDTQRGTRVSLCAVAAAPARPAQLQAHARGSSSPPPPRCPRWDTIPSAAGIRTRCVMGPHGTECSSTGERGLVWVSPEAVVGAKPPRERAGLWRGPGGSRGWVRG